MPRSQSDDRLRPVKNRKGKPMKVRGRRVFEDKEGYSVTRAGTVKAVPGKPGKFYYAPTISRLTGRRYKTEAGMRVAAKRSGSYKEFSSREAAQAHSRKQSARDASATQKKYARKAGTKGKANTLRRRRG